MRGFTAVVDAIGGLGERLDRILLGPVGTMVRQHDEAIGELRTRVSRLDGPRRHLGEPSAADAEALAARRRLGLPCRA